MVEERTLAVLAFSPWKSPFMPVLRSRILSDRPSLTATALVLGLLLTPMAGAASLREQAEAVMERHCLDCHDAETQKGDVRLDGLDGLPLEPRLELLNRLQEQVHLKQMPPGQGLNLSPPMGFSAWTEPTRH